MRVVVPVKSAALPRQVCKVVRVATEVRRRSLVHPSHMRVVVVEVLWALVLSVVVRELVVVAPAVQRVVRIMHPPEVQTRVVVRVVKIRMLRHRPVGRVSSFFDIQRVQLPRRAARSRPVVGIPSTRSPPAARSRLRTFRVRLSVHHHHVVRRLRHLHPSARHHRSARLRGRGQTSNISSLRAVVVVVLLPVVVAVVVDFLRTVLRSHQAPHTPSRLVEVDPVRPRPVRAPTGRIVYLVLSRQSVVVVAAVM